MPNQEGPTIRLGLPKGRMQEGVFGLLRDAGLPLRTGAREYRPSVGLPGFEAKIQKPQNIIEMLDSGTRDIGFAGADWVKELGADVVELLDTGMDPVRLVAAAPTNLLENGRLPKRHLVVASEYQKLTTDWIHDRGLDARLLRTYGATEVFPPEDADCIVDITQTGQTLSANGLEIFDTMGTSSTRLLASRHAMDDPAKRERIDELVTLVRSVLDARSRVMIEVNVCNEALEAVKAILPCMRKPTISKLTEDAGYAMKAAVPRKDLPTLILRLRQAGGTDIVVGAVSQIIP